MVFEQKNGFNLFHQNCRDHSVGPEAVCTSFTYIVLVKGVFSPVPPTVGILSPLNLQYHVVNLIGKLFAIMLRYRHLLCYFII